MTDADFPPDAGKLTKEEEVDLRSRCHVFHGTSSAERLVQDDILQLAHDLGGVTLCLTDRPYGCTKDGILGGILACDLMPPDEVGQFGFATIMQLV